MPRFEAKRIRCGRIIDTAMLEVANTYEAWCEANDGLDPLKGDWAEVREIKPEQDDANE